MPKSRRRSPRRPSPRRRPTVQAPRALRSPVTGDLGYPDHPWIRLDHVALGLSLPTVMFDQRELLHAGFTPAELGFTHAAAHQYHRFEAPRAKLIVDLKSRYDLDLYHADSPDSGEPELVVGGVFPDPHPPQWWSLVHAERDMMLIVGDTPRLAAAITGEAVDVDPVAVLLDAWVARSSGLMLRAYPSGVGTHPLEPQPNDDPEKRSGSRLS